MTHDDDAPPRRAFSRLRSRLAAADPGERLSWAGVSVAGSATALTGLIVIDWAIPKIVAIVGYVWWLMASIMALVR